MPGVESASESGQEPPLNYERSDTIIPGRPHAERWETRFDVCSEDYFRILDVPLLKGRLFPEDDLSAGRFVMVVNQAFANQYFQNQEPLGQRVKLEVLDRPFLGAPHDAYFEVVGVVREVILLNGKNWVTPIGGCSLVLKRGNSNRGVRQLGPTSFECELIPDGWSNVEGLLEPFCKPDTTGFQWPTTHGRIALLISQSGKW